MGNCHDDVDVDDDQGSFSNGSLDGECWLNSPWTTTLSSGESSLDVSANSDFGPLTWEIRVPGQKPIIQTASSGEYLNVECDSSGI